jgi:7-cyano-7-deazaguanine synthase
MVNTSAIPASQEAVVLMSGGIDSAACASFLLEHGNPVTAVFVDYGQRAAIPEKKSVVSLTNLLSIQLETIAVKFPASFGAGEIIGRNAFLVFAAIVGCQMRTGSIVLGIHSGTSYYDCTPAFVESTNRLVEEYTDGRVRLLAPFVSWTKQNIFNIFALLVYQ